MKLKPLKKGKVRNIYELAADRLLMIATDRISAFDVVMHQKIPGKGKVLTQVSAFWFKFIEERKIIKTHFISASQRAMTVKKAIPVPLEFIVRGYLYGSAWPDYELGKSWMSQVWPGLKLASKLPTPIVQLTTKAETDHDQPLDYHQAKLFFADWVKNNGIKSVFNPYFFFDDLVAKCLDIYNQAKEYAEGRGIIIADTKFEFGFDVTDGSLMLIDELFTPDSSRLWLLELWRPGFRQEGRDKQPLRDWLEETGWPARRLVRRSPKGEGGSLGEGGDKSSPPPDLSEDIIKLISERYQDIQKRLLS